MEFKVLGARLIVKEFPPEEQTSNGIILPDKAQEKSFRGLVVAIGNGMRDSKGNLIPMDVKVGDKVIFAKFAGTPIKDDDGKEYIVINERDILAIEV